MYDKGTKSNRRRSIEKIKIKKNNSLTPPSRNSARYSRSSSSSPNYRRSHRSRCNSSYSRSRSRESRTYRRSSRCSYSRSRSYSSHRSKSNDRRRSYSRSSKSVPSRKKYHGNRENPQESRCLGIFGLSIYTTEQQITEIFSKYGNVVSVQIVLDAKTGRSRGYGFIYFENCEQAKLAKENCSGMEIDERRIRVDYSITLRAHTPTPGVYMGKPTRYNDGYESQQNSSSSHRHHSSSSHHHHHHHHRSSRHARRSRTPTPYYHHRDRKKRVRSRSHSHSARRDRHYR